MTKEGVYSFTPTSYLTGVKNMYAFINPKFKIFKSYKNDIDFILLKDNFTFGVVVKKNNKICEEEILAYYRDEITDLINLDLPYNIIRELWVVQKRCIYKVDVITRKIIYEGY